MVAPIEKAEKQREHERFQIESFMIESFTGLVQGFACNMSRGTTQYRCPVKSISVRSDFLELWNICSRFVRLSGLDGVKQKAAV